MNNATHHFKRPASYLAAQVPRPPAHCVPEDEVIAHEVGAPLQRCFKSGGRKAGSATSSVTATSHEG
ncbi:MAG: hypothetical protein QOE70_2951 [Chthoniobacter sp.]|jgi:hypothetical protein|nr:hypothetical protein [Chthoniobacter sp.]